MNEERFKIVVCGFSQLPPEVDRNDLSENGVGSEDASYLLVYLDGKLLRCESSAMEPEDVSFYRDLRWVSQAIIEAWEAALALRDVPQGQASEFERGVDSALNILFPEGNLPRRYVSGDWLDRSEVRKFALAARQVPVGPEGKK